MPWCVLGFSLRTFDLTFRILDSLDIILDAVVTVVDAAGIEKVSLPPKMS